MKQYIVSNLGHSMQGGGKDNCYWQHGWIRVILSENIRYRRKYSLFPLTRSSGAGKTHSSRKSILGPLSAGGSLTNPSRRDHRSRSAPASWWPKGRDQECWHVRGDVTGLGGLATQALETHNMQKGIAARIRKECGKKPTPTWRCFVGGTSYMTHDTEHCIHFYPGRVAILFKSG